MRRNVIGEDMEREVDIGVVEVGEERGRERGEERVWDMVEV